MPAKRGRPAGNAADGDNKEKIIRAVVALIKKDGAGTLTVRQVCKTADVSIGTFYHYFQNKDDLLMYFVREESFAQIELRTPLTDFAGRITELYMYLVRKYQKLGRAFMCKFYTTDNMALSAYLCSENNAFLQGTVMARCQQEAELARQQAILRLDIDTFQLSQDICTIVKGCVFEYNLTNEKMDLEGTLRRILERYIAGYMK